MSGRPHLLFVYNADSGLFNTISDIGHKIFSPQTYDCRLCAITHGYFVERKAWRTFIEALAAECEFLHRDEFRRRYPANDTSLPAVLRVTRDGPVPCMDSTQVAGCADLGDLQKEIRCRCFPDCEADRRN